jgi:hypothetical protein
MQLFFPREGRPRGDRPYCAVVCSMTFLCDSERQQFIIREKPLTLSLKGRGNASHFQNPFLFLSLSLSLSCRSLAPCGRGQGEGSLVLKLLFAFSQFAVAVLSFQKKAIHLIYRYMAIFISPEMQLHISREG